MSTPKKGTTGKKPPGMTSFVVWRQFFMVLAAPGMGNAFMPLLGPDTSYFAVMVGTAVPALIHGQLWNWTYKWADKGPQTLRQLRVGQVALGAVHCALAGWALFRVATGEVSWDGAAFYYGLTIAGFAGGVWETIRPFMELQADSPKSNRDSGSSAVAEAVTLPASGEITPEVDTEAPAPLRTQAPPPEEEEGSSTPPTVMMRDLGPGDGN
jgi:hypothetical protein